MLTLYPNIKPYTTHMLPVEEPHVLYIEECGDPEGIPVLFLHGGPGIGCDSDHRRYFNPEKFRIILFDQRGCGHSTPHGELKHNNTQALISDIETIREHLHIEHWILFGGSWGSTLALVYAETHPKRVLYMILRGIFLCRPEDIQWFYQSGAHRLFPDHWEEFIQVLPENERNDLLTHYYLRLTGSDEIARITAAKAWAQWEGACATLHPNPPLIARMTQTHTAMSLARIEAHYFIHHAFLSTNQILKHAHRLSEIPGTIVHGRYDVICPLDNAYALHQAWPLSELQIIRDAGHSACEPGMIHALISATNFAAQRYAL